MIQGILNKLCRYFVILWQATWRQNFAVILLKSTNEFKDTLRLFIVVNEERSKNFTGEHFLRSQCVDLEHRVHRFICPLQIVKMSTFSLADFFLLKNCNCFIQLMDCVT